MNSKQEIYHAMQRVMNDMTNQHENIPTITFIEVAKLLAKIGQETVEPELFELTTSYCKLMVANATFIVQENDSNMMVFIKPESGKERLSVVKNTKENLFNSYLRFIANEMI